MKQLLLVVMVLTALLFQLTVVYARSDDSCSGQVIDSMTGEPIAGASVFISWEEIGPGMEKYVIVKAVMTSTDEQGKYFLLDKNLKSSFSGLMSNTGIVIYQPGYQLFDRRPWHNRPKDRHTTNLDKIPEQRENRVFLDRVPPVFDHNAHFTKIKKALDFVDDQYRYIGNPLLYRAEWEKGLRRK